MKYDIIVVPLGYKNDLPIETRLCHQIIELDTQAPILPQLMDIQTEGKGLTVVTPDWAPDDLKHHFVKTVGQAWVAVCQTRNTIGKFYHQWMDNAYSNYLDLINATPVCKAGTKGKTKAIICGIGPSLYTSLEVLENPPEDVAVFACWHAAPRMTSPIDYLCHVHSEKPGDDYKNYEAQKKTTFIANPTVCPEFLKLRHGNKLLAYLNINFTHVTPLIKKHQVKEHHSINATVASMMLGSACYMGFKEIALVGIDHAWLDDADTHETALADGVEKTVNRYGVSLKTSNSFKVAAAGLSDFVTLFPDSKIVQTSMNALDMNGIDYQPLSEFLNG